MPGGDLGRVIAEVFTPERLAELRASIAPWDGYPDAVLRDVADVSDGLVQYLAVRSDKGTRIATDAAVANMVLGARGILRGCT
jgi:hypothetical protein